MIAKKRKYSRNTVFGIIGGDTIKWPDIVGPPKLQGPKA